MSKRPLDYVGPAPVWHTVIYPDGTTYEGLMKRDLCELRGVMVYGDTGERYAGQWRENNMEGLGERDYNNGVIYRGQFHQAQEHGCGVKVIYDEDAEEGVIIQAGEFSQGVFLGPTVYCDVIEAVETAAEATMEAERAKLFMMKPDGALVNKEKHVRDPSGNLLVSAEEWDTLVQDPLYYPPGTEYLMPGPRGDLYYMPEGEEAGEGRASEENRKLRLKYGEQLAGWISNFYKYAPDDEIEPTEAQTETVEYYREKARKFLVTRDELGLEDVEEDSSTAPAAAKDPSEIGRIVIERRKDDDDDEFENDDDEYEDEEVEEEEEDDDEDNKNSGGNVASRAASISLALQPLAATTIHPPMRAIARLLTSKTTTAVPRQQESSEAALTLSTNKHRGGFILRGQAAPGHSLRLKETTRRVSQNLKLGRSGARSLCCRRRAFSLDR